MTTARPVPRQYSLISREAPALQPGADDPSESEAPSGNTYSYVVCICKPAWLHSMYLTAGIIQILVNVLKRKVVNRHHERSALYGKCVSSHQTLVYLGRNLLETQQC